MKNISDIIEGYLKSIIETTKQGQIEIKRNEVAEKFQCVPSQINYVINTRFTVDRGYLVESKRGGGGYIRIFRVAASEQTDVIRDMLDVLEGGASESMVEDMVYRLLDLDMISKREAKLIVAACARSTLSVPLPLRDQLRGRVAQAMLLTLLQPDKER
ncbi:CtsR family transcriptional regulator [Chryseomicrobium excrementi]|uniref:Transcriptional regulator CtsR n=1 Tax=Chryseomicrobium excrementi TaxID=2041346 RepID=A0A2M9EYS2_9BACL|nr:CtsR family transcriptional regulator [Chryseomicrobium excrementi]PJK16346.1 CtsR family transcriptional regulator [Chryseomicrobium excrementi]